MSFFAANQHIIAIAGRSSVHVYPLSFTPVQPFLPLDLKDNLPEESKANPDKLCCVCVDISSCGNFVLAADSGKNVFLFEYIDDGWELFSSWEMDRRLVRVQFDRRDTYVIMTDKTGDVYVSYKGPKTITGPKKILGHTSFILDVALTKDNKTIITCDRDEKVRISNFPGAYEVIGYRLGHKEPVVSVAVVNDDNNLISVAVDGEFTLWRFTDHKSLRTWNICDIVQAERGPQNEVTRMRATEYMGKCFVGFIISGIKELQVLQLHCIDKTLRLFGRTRLENDFADFCWYGNHSMLVYNPELGTIKKYSISEHGLICVDFSIPSIVVSARKDWAAFAEYNKPYYTLKKRALGEQGSSPGSTRAHSSRHQAAGPSKFFKPKDML